MVFGMVSALLHPLQPEEYVLVVRTQREKREQGASYWNGKREMTQYIVLVTLLLLFWAESLRLKSGYEKRAIRALAHRWKVYSLLHFFSPIFFPELFNPLIPSRRKTEKKLVAASVPKVNQLSDAFVLNCDEILSARELLLLRTGTSKKKEAEAVGHLLADKLKAEVAQVLGHTVLLYREANPPKEATRCLEESSQIL